MLLGVIADDLTGATDVALMLAREGMRVVQTVGTPASAAALPDADAVVVSLKSRTNPPDEAVAWSLASCEALLGAGARQILFKYCSTFDSTDRGNIGPVAEALMARLGAAYTIACPAFPANGRSVYQGHLFVGSALLSDSPMKDHPLTPMRDANLVRVLGRQTRLPVGLVPYQTVAKGAAATRAAFEALAKDGAAIGVADAVTDADLRTLGEAFDGAPLLTGGSGIALGLPENFRRAGLLRPAAAAAPFAAPRGLSAVLAGSCSAATRGQVRDAEERGVPAFAIDPVALAEGRLSAADVLAWAKPRLGATPVLVYSTAEPEAVRAIQERFGREASGAMVERLLGEVARGLVEAGVSRLVVAGGETSGAVVGALGVTMLEIGPEIDPGVPWTLAADGHRIALALKSGNFGGRDFFTRSLSMLD
ncbi:four-carbon acid sugar kinase family protein [Alsobacter sp. SYSU M60028]|uniref:3-oxo-tetronate kinase n=1 Tax=Alsobacter ponti TaxID=2962936 RepID=A0ABT1LAA8_9HYPH|nr:3-oxo-tetronate kinase [Alsobacter ponti]MCP8937685.1 four-carbon acid sugar kinase family protein [Alsobacter ponti]